MCTIYTDKYEQPYLLNNEELTASVLYNTKAIVIDIPSDIEYNNKVYKVKLPNNCSELFRNNTKLKYFTLGKLDTSNVTNTERMFAECKFLKFIDITNFNTENITNMTDMFRNCINLQKINISNFNLTGLSDIGKDNLYSIFKNCINLETIDIPMVTPPVAFKLYKYSKNLFT